jgi:uncharacterized membrane protein SpoIIM required for sporulation
MIIDLQKYISEERRYWSELEAVLDRLERRPEVRLSLSQLERFHYLYRRASADLSKIMTFSAEPNTRHYLEALVARAFGQVHGTRQSAHPWSLLEWFFSGFPNTFRKHIKAFWICLIAMLVGAAFGGFVVLSDTESKIVLLPFSHLQGDPSDRVEREESVKRDHLENTKASFSSFLMTHNTKVAILTLGMGITWGIGTLILLFYNGTILGAVALDYISAGEAQFLLGWLLPHGIIEIPAILLAGQAGLVLAGALIGWGKPIPLRLRLRAIGSDLVTLIFGVSLLLVWAAIVEAFFSQYHEPVIPYELKIGFGIFELIALVFFLGKSGK